MKKRIVLLCIVLFASALHAQYVANGSFENWYVKTHFTYPDNWTIHGDPFIINQTVQQELPGYSGNYALKLTTIDTNNLGFAILGSFLTDSLNNNTFIGYPFNTPGDTLRLWYKADIEPGDAAIIIVRITKNGNLINEVQHLITGTHQNWTALKLAVNPLLLQPDSIFIGFASSYPFGAPFQQVAGSWLAIDNVYFTQGTDPAPITIPNHSFENWSFVQSEEPSQWLSSNTYVVSSQMPNVVKTFDVYDGTYALKMSNANLDGNVISGFATNSTTDLYSGGVPFNLMPENWYASYKYQPVDSDTAFINVSFFKNNNLVAGDFFQIYDSSGIYQYFERPLYFNEQPDTVRIEIFAGQHAGSVLYVDALDFSCNKPSSLSAQNITPTSATTSWIENGDADTWDIEYGLFPLALGTGTNIQTTSNPSLLNNLSPDTHYDYFIRAVCGVGKHSLWTYNSFKTECEIQNFPLTENFESLSSYSWPNCWRKIEEGFSNITAGNYGQSVSPNNSLRIDLTQNDTALFISPHIGVNLNMLQVSFFGKRTANTHPLFLTIGSLTNSEDMSTFQAYATVNLQTFFTNHTIYLNAYVGSGLYIAFMFTADGNNEVFLDDIELAYLPLCLPPGNLSASNITNNSAFIYWTPGGSEVLWDIKYGYAGFNPAVEGTSINSINQNNTTISGLSPGTAYDLYLRADCGSGNESIWVQTSFQTLCLPFILPYIENFDNTPMQSIPTCWHDYKTGGAMVEVVDWNQFTSPTNSLYMYAPSTDSIYAILPQIDASIDTMMLMFKAKKETWAGPCIIEIGIITDINDIQTYTPLSQFSLFDAFKPIAYLFNNYQGAAGSIALRLLSSDAAAIFIDDVNVQFLPSCMPPVNVSTDMLTDTSLTLTWQSGGSETHWDIVYGLYGFDINTQGQLISNHNQASINIGSLEKDTHYEFFVRASCGLGEKSVWSGLEVTTPCMPDTIPFIENFDNIVVTGLPKCWRIYTSGASEAQILDWGESTSGLQSMYLYLGSGDSAFVILPEISTPLDTLMLAFFAKKDSWVSHATIEAGVIGSYPDMGSYTAYHQFQMAVNFKSFSALFHYFQGINGRLALRLTAADAAAVFIDDISLGFLPSCLPPYNITINNLTDTLADISWTAGGNETLWTIKYGVAGFDPTSQGQEIGGINIPSAIIGGLSHGSSYDVYLRADCGGNDTSLWAQIGFTTLCLPISLPLNEDFELTQPHHVPNCWQTYTTGYAQAEVLAQGYANSGVKSLYLGISTGDSAFIILPETSAHIDTLLLTFFGMKVSGVENAVIEAGIISTPNDISTFSALHQISLSNSFKPYALSFDNYQGAAGQMVLRLVSADVALISIDDIRVGHLPSCVPPQHIVTNTGDTSVHISWGGNSNVQFWDIIYGFAGFNPLTEGVSINGINQNDTILGGLQAGTLYDIYLRADCGNSDTSIWTSAAFQTLCQNIQLPLFENFENTIPGNLPLCWESQINGAGDISTISWSQSVSGGQVMRLLNYQGGTLILMSPDFSYFSDTIALGFYAMKNPLLGDAKIVIGTLLNQSAPASFSPLDTFSLTDQYLLYNQYFFDNPAQHQCIAFKLNNFGEDVEVYIDDVSFEFVQHCNPPGNVVFENITDSSVRVKWQSFGSDTLWQIMYGTQGFDTQTAGILADSVSEHEIHIVGLQAATTYDIYIRADCGSNAFSDWRGPIVFKTGLKINNTVLQHTNCPNDTTAISYVTAEGGTSPYSYHWFTQPPQFGDTAYGLSAGTHIVKVVDANNYFSYDTIIINGPPVFVIEKTINPVLCYSQSNGSIAINVSGGNGGYSYLWSTGSTQSQISNMLAGAYFLTVTDALNCKAYDTIHLPQPDNLIINTVLHKNISCRGYNDGQLAVSAAGGTLPYQYQWNTNPIVYDSAAGNLGVGFHRVTVTDANACLAIRTFSITQPGQALGASLTTNHATCANNNSGSALVNAYGGTPPYTYAWSNGVASAVNINLNGGKYKITLTDNNGCLFIDSVIIKEPKITLTKTDVLCHGQTTGSILLKIENFPPGYNINWANNIDSISGTSVIGNVFYQNISGLAAGTYYVAVSDTFGCTVNGSITITQPQLMSVSVTKADLLCSGDNNGSITVIPQVVYPPYSYAWSTGATSNSIQNLTAGTYHFTVTDGLQCQFIDNISILAPLPLTANPIIVNNACYGENSGSIDLNMSGGTPPYSFIWSSSSNSEMIAGLAAGNYWFTVTDVHMCQHTDTINITESDSPISITPQIVNVLCFGNNTGAISTTTTGGVPPYAYLWSSGQTTQHINNLPAGAYVLTLTDNISCQQIDTFIVNQAATPLDVNFQFTAYVCEGQTTGGAVKAIGSGGNPPYYYIWSNDEQGPQITNLSIGIYTVTVIDASGCSFVDSVMIQPHVVYVPPVYGPVTVFEDSIAMYHIQNISQSSFDWTVTNGAIINGTGLSADTIIIQWGNAGQGIINITKTDTNNCIGDTVIYINISPYSSLEDKYAKDTIRIYPNPASSVIFVEVNAHNTSGFIWLYDAMGKLIGFYDIQKFNAISLENLSSGVYFIRIGQSAFPFIKNSNMHQ